MTPRDVENTRVWLTPKGAALIRAYDAYEGYLQENPEDAMFAVQAALDAVLPGILAQHRANVLREAADYLDSTVPPDVFPFNSEMVDGHSARMRRADASILRRMADEAVTE